MRLIVCLQKSHVLVPATFLHHTNVVLLLALLNCMPFSQLLTRILETVPLPPLVFPQNGTAVALEVIAELRRGGFKGLVDVVERLKQRVGEEGVFISSTPAKVTLNFPGLFS